MIKCYPLIVFVVLLCSLQQAHSFLDYQGSSVVFKKGKFLLPNENYPHLALPIWQQSQGGIYLSVGSDRSFIGAAASNATHLLALDFDPGIVAYNRIMIEMLKIADNGADLLRMRTDFAYLQMKFSHAKECSADKNFLERTLKDPGFKDVIESIKCLKSEYAVEQDDMINHINAPHAFIDHWMWRNDDQHPEVIYWKNPILFNKMQTMAREGRIQAELFDLQDISRLAELSASINRANLTISVFDFSNTQNQFFLGARGINTVINALNSVLLPQSILLFSFFDILVPWAPLSEYTAFFMKDYSFEVFSNKHELTQRALLSVSSEGQADPF